MRRGFRRLFNVKGVGQRPYENTGQKGSEHSPRHRGVDAEDRRVNAHWQARQVKRVAGVRPLIDHESRCLSKEEPCQLLSSQREWRNHGGKTNLPWSSEAQSLFLGDVLDEEIVEDVPRRRSLRINLVNRD